MIFHYFISSVAAKTLDELRQRLRDKIESLKKNRIENEEKKQKKHNIKRQSREEKESAPVEEKRPKVDETQHEEEKKQVPAISTPSVNDVISKSFFFLLLIIVFNLVRFVEQKKWIPVSVQR